MYRKVDSRAWSLTQEKFNLEMGLTDAADSPPVTWIVPVTFQRLPVVGRDPGDAATIWLRNQTARVTAPTNLDRSTYIFNVGKFA